VGCATGKKSEGNKNKTCFQVSMFFHENSVIRREMRATWHFRISYSGSLWQVLTRTLLNKRCKNEKLFFEPVSKRSILSKVKEGDNFNHRNILNISRLNPDYIGIEPDAEIGQKWAF